MSHEIPMDEKGRVLLRNNANGLGLILTTLALLAMGAVAVYSALSSPTAPDRPWWMRTSDRNLIFVSISAMIAMVAWRFDYHWLTWGKRLPWLPTAALALAIVTSGLVFVSVFGHERHGQVRWLRIGGFGFQPSELMKFALPIFLAVWLTRPSVKVQSFLRTFVPAIALVGLCAGLGIKEDFSAGMMTALAGGNTLLLAGVPWYYLLMLLPPAAGATYVAVAHSADKMARIKAWLNPWDLNNDAAYQLRESLIAILNGGWKGPGLGNGLIKLGFLPERSTDFIFSVICEEMGFIGAMLVVGLFLLFIWNARKSALNAADRLGAVLAGSFGALIAAQAVIHVAVAVGAIPPMGMALPFVSAGGTGMLVLVAMVAVMVSVTAHRKAATPLAG